MRQIAIASLFLVMTSAAAYADCSAFNVRNFFGFNAAECGNWPESSGDSKASTETAESTSGTGSGTSSGKP